MPAQIFSRGTMVRNRWDFYELADAWCYVNGLIGTGTNSNILLLNNGQAGTHLDIYYACASAAAAVNFVWWFAGPGLTAGFTIPPATTVHATQLDQSQPPGIGGIVISNAAAAANTLRARADLVSFDEIKPGVDGPFVVLPPGYALLVTTNNPNQVAAVTILYQSVLDQAPQAGV